MFKGDFGCLHLQSKAIGAQHPRVAMWAALEKVDSEEKLLFLNTHFDHPTTEAAEGNRTRSAEQIGKFIQQDWPGWPAVVTLDANAEPGAPAHRKFEEMGLVDSWAECHPDALCADQTHFINFWAPGYAEDYGRQIKDSHVVLRATRAFRMTFSSGP